MKIKIKRLSPDAVVPVYGKVGDAGLDFTAISQTENTLYTEYGTGLAVEIPPGFVGLIFPRSSCSDYSQILSNCVGVLDSNYRGEIKFRFKDVHKGSLAYAKDYQIGNKIGQLIVMPIPSVEFEEVEELGETNRGTAGYGSSGK